MGRYGSGGPHEKPPVRRAVRAARGAHKLPIAVSLLVFLVGVLFLWVFSRLLPHCRLSGSVIERISGPK